MPLPLFAQELLFCVGVVMEAILIVGLGISALEPIMFCSNDIPPVFEFVSDVFSFAKVFKTLVFIRVFSR